MTRQPDFDGDERTFQAIAAEADEYRGCTPGPSYPKPLTPEEEDAARARGRAVSTENRVQRRLVEQRKKRNGT